jgi:hypothetical protein
VWISVNTALRLGQRGLPGGSSLAQLLSENRDVRNRGDLPVLTIDQVLAWADELYGRTGAWPSAESGPIRDASGETWASVNSALARGLRGLPGGSSLAKELARHRGRRNRKGQAPLTVEEILAWADAHHESTGTWPKRSSGPVHAAEDETWGRINDCLVQGGRNLPGGSSLPRLLAEQRGVRNKQDLPRLTVDRILGWVDAHRQRTDGWPTQDSGPVVDAPGETWRGVQMALYQGLRGLPGGSSLAQLLSEMRGVRNGQDLPPFTIDQILTWADAHHSSMGKWPTASSGSVLGAPGETWNAIDRALRAGVRGLPGASSLARLLAEQRGRQHHLNRTPLTVQTILAWADAHHERAGSWPNRKSGPVLGAPGESWQRIDAALRQGHRSLPGGSSLSRLLAECRGVRNAGNPPDLSEMEILRWALAHKERTGEWPRVKSGAIPEAPGELWSNVDAALRGGFRSLPGGSSLFRLINTVVHSGQEGADA